MTYFGYKPPDQDKSVIDWAGLTKTISDNLLAEKKRRDDTKVFLDQENAKQLQKINEFEQTQDPQANIWMTQQIQSARDFMMENHRLMKRGLRSVNDKRLVQQNVMNTYTDVNNALKSYNAKLIELEKAGGKSNEAIIDEMAKFARLKDRKIHNDPNTGAGYLVDVDPTTGEIDEKNLMPVRAINNMMQQAFETVNVTDEVDKAVGKMATWKVALSATSDISNVRLNPKYQQTIDDLSRSILSSDEKKASVLLDYLDLDYSRDADDAAQGTITYDFITGYDEQGKPTIEEREINIGKVFMELGSDGRLKHTLTKEQEDLALEAIKSNIETKLLFETSKDKPTATDISEGKARQSKIDTYNTVERFFQGSPEAGQSLAQQYGMDSVPIIEGDKMVYTIGGKEYTSDASGNVKDASSTFIGGLANATGGKYGMSVEDYGRWSTNTNVVPTNFGTVATSLRPVTAVENYVTPKNVQAIQKSVVTQYTDKDNQPVVILPEQQKANAIQSLQQLGAGKFEVSPGPTDSIKIERDGRMEFVTVRQLQENPEAVLQKMQGLVRKPSSSGASRFNP